METVIGDNEGSILRSLLFNIFLADRFVIISNLAIASYLIRMIICGYLLK